MSNLTPSPHVIQTLRKADAICFDVDSTVIPSEGIDDLAAHCQVKDIVAAFTQQAMNGQMKFEEALQKRLELMKVTEQQLQSCIEQHPHTLTTDFLQLIQLLNQLQKPVYLISGGFRQMINSINNRYNITHPTRIYANTLVFNTSIGIATFDPLEPTCRSGGKAKVIELIKQQLSEQYRHPVSVVMCGDGVTDMEARPPADLFVGYGGVVEREAVKRGADWFINSWKQLIEVLQQQDGKQ